MAEDTASSNVSEGDRRARFDRSIARIDAANAEDPILIAYRGEQRQKEPLHAELMTQWLLRLDPSADELAQLAARAHHFKRWTLPRSEYPEGRAGYLRWRTAAQRQHADEVGAILAEEGYSAAEVARVAEIIRKEHRRADPVVQTHEDARCLVFLQTQLDGVADQLGYDATVQVLVKTLPKMSAAGVAAVSEIDLGDRGATLVAQAVEVVRRGSGE